MELEEGSGNFLDATPGFFLSSAPGGFNGAGGSNDLNMFFHSLLRIIQI
jgi:hypothetical protein